MYTHLTPAFFLPDLPGVDWLVGLLSTLFVLLYLVAPLVVMASIKAKRACPINLIPEEEVPQAVRSLWYASAPQLEKLGFGDAVHLCIEGPVGEMHNYLQIQFQGNGQTLISQTAIMTTDGRIQTSYDEFMTSYSGDRSILTQNSKMLGGFADVPEKRVASFAGEKDLAALHSAHLKHLRLHPFGAPTPQGATGLFEVIERSLRLDFERQVERGYFKLSSDGTVFQPTVKGAFLMTWRQLQPWKTLQKLKRRQLCKTILDIDDNGQPGRTEMAPSISPN